METYLSEYVHQVIVRNAENNAKHNGNTYLTSLLTYDWQEIEKELGGISDDLNVLDQPEVWYLTQTRVVWDVVHSAAAAFTASTSHERDNLSQLCDWVCCQRDVTEYLSWANREPEVGSLLATLHMTAALERALGNILLMKNQPVPFLLRDLLQTEQLKLMFNKVPIVFMQLILGSPKGFNLRNVLWHGFVTPGELSPDIVVGLIVLFASLGQELQYQKIPKRPQFHLFEKFHSELKGVFPDLTTQSEEVPAIVDISLYIPDKSRVLWIQAFELFRNRLYGDSLVLLMPQLEHCLRMIYCQVNDCPGRLLTAESTSLYTTLDEILAPAQYPVVKEGLLMMLLDLTSSLTGPRLRDRLSHGECDLSSLPQWLVNHVFCVALCVSHQQKDGVHKCSSVLCSELQTASSCYRSRFHVMASLFGRIGNLLDNWVEWQHCPPPSDLPETSLDSCPHIATWAELMFHGDERVVERVKTVSFHLRQQEPPILYRPRAELELATALLGVVDSVVQTVDKLRHAAAYRHQMWSARTLRSRARMTCHRMWALLPELWTGLLCILMITTRCYQSLPLLAQHAQVAHRLVKAMSKTVGNTVTLCDVDKNRWNEARSLLSTLAYFAVDWISKHSSLLGLDKHFNAM
uniref:DUF4209 domain-containing protein n=1 Tax=Cuerna arida TaxID=1464854 RepID=A0A1B6EJH3_9HEMI